MMHFTRSKVYSLRRLFSTGRQIINYDVVVVGGGVAGLSTAIKIKQQEAISGHPVSVCVIQKGTEVGDHILSGNCFETRGFEELFPDWRKMGDKKPPIQTQVTSDNFYLLLDGEFGINIPHILFPKTIDNSKNFIISLSKLTRWMGEQATQYGVDVFPGTPGSEVLYGNEGQVVGVATKDTGIGKHFQPKDNFQQGIQIRAKQTIFAQGCRGSLTETVIEKFNLRQNCDPQLYGIGLKQVWEIPEGHANFKPGYVQHTVGWPLEQDTYGGTFMYHMAPNLIHLGLVVGLNYKNPYLNPYEEFQRMKTHPQIRKYLEGGQCISYGARALNSGGYFSIPRLTFQGGMLVGCSAGFMNLMKIKGSHTAIKSGVEAGKAIYNHFKAESAELQIKAYEDNMKQSWAFKELHASRNFKMAFKNLGSGLAYGAFFKLFEGREKFDLRAEKKDSACTQPASMHSPIEYPPHDRKLTFDLLDNLSRSGTNHEHDQPTHLVVKPHKQNTPSKSLLQFGAPQERFCPAKVYEFVDDGKGGRKLQINAQNCLHCKTCSIKMVDEYIEWKTPQGNGGPKYNLM